MQGVNILVFREDGFTDWKLFTYDHVILLKPDEHHSIYDLVKDDKALEYAYIVLKKNEDGLYDANRTFILKSALTDVYEDGVYDSHIMIDFLFDDSYNHFKLKL